LFDIGKIPLLGQQESERIERAHEADLHPLCISLRNPWEKAHDCWIWIALCRKTRQVVGYAIGDRSKKTCQRLWEAIPDNSRAGHCFTDFWATYQAVIPEAQHTAVGKETGETAHVERWKNTLRQRLARFVRMTLSFSTSVVMHEACLLLFLYRYNLDRAILLT
jgi:insertion element IS1 protein InsB